MKYDQHEMNPNIIMSNLPLILDSGTNSKCCEKAVSVMYFQPQ